MSRRSSSISILTIFSLTGSVNALALVYSIVSSNLKTLKWLKISH